MLASILLVTLKASTGGPTSRVVGKYLRFIICLHLPYLHLPYLHLPYLHLPYLRLPNAHPDRPSETIPI
jgi:hypothetical protein